MDGLIEAACNLAGTAEIGAIHVVMSRRPTYTELVRYRQEAESRALALNVDATGVSLRPQARDGGKEQETASWTDFRLPISDLRPPSSIFRWLSAQGRAWCAEFSAMSEGTR
jgi:hypothetical protein